MRVLITGSRTWPARDMIYDELYRLYKLPRNGEFTVIVGGAPGADTIAQEWAEENGVNFELYMADWKQYGRAAGPIRNQVMVDSGADLCIAFPVEGSKGTKDCIHRAMKAGIPTHIFVLEGV